MADKGDQARELQLVRQIVSQVSRIELSELRPDVLIREELGIDSLMAMEIVATCELQLGIRIDEGRLYEVQTVGDFESLVLGLLRERPEPHG